VFPFGFLGLSLSLPTERDHTCPHHLIKEKVFVSDDGPFQLLVSEPKVAALGC